MGGWCRAGRATVAAVAVVAAWAGSAPVTSAAPLPERASPGCAQAVARPLDGGVYLDTPASRVVVGMRCRYVSTAAGGYRVDGGAPWHVTIVRPDGSRIGFGSVHGSATCADDVVRRGDRVEVASSGLAITGPGAGCSAPLPGGRGCRPRFSLQSVSSLAPLCSENEDASPSEVSRP
jgi:hypothetical protein